MKESNRWLVCYRVAILGLLVALLGLQIQLKNTLEQQQPPGETRVYVTEQPHQVVQVYDTPGGPSTGSLEPNTRVSMVCWQKDSADRKWFRVVIDQLSLYRPGGVVMVPADDVHNEVLTDHC